MNRERYVTILRKEQDKLVKIKDLYAGEYYAGRSLMTDISIPQDKFLSRIHFKLEIRELKYGAISCVVKDCGSKNGTEVRQSKRKKLLEKNESIVLESYDSIKAGASLFVVILSERLNKMDVVRNNGTTVL